MILKSEKGAIPIIIIVLIVLGAVIFLAKGGLQNLQQGFSWCKEGNSFKLKNKTVNALGVEDYKGRLEGKVCHLTQTENGITADYFVDEPALAKLKGSKSKEIGNGCIVYRIKLSAAATEFCFGSKVKEPKDEGKIEIAAPKDASDLTGSKWQYKIQSGGGVGGILTFEKGAKGEVSGKFSENGPQGSAEKTFKGNWDGTNLLLSLTDFPTLKITLVSGGKSMNGKPEKIDPKAGISYPDDFFHADRQP